MINESIASEELMETVFVGLRETQLDYTNTVLISGNNPCKGIPHTAERKALISAALKGIKRSDEFKQRVSKSLMGHEVTDEAKQKMSESARNRPMICCTQCSKVVRGTNNLTQHCKFAHPQPAT